MKHIEITKLPPETLIPHTQNARQHSAKQILQVANSIQEFGFLVPVLIDSSGGIIAGHCRVEAAKELGMQQIPCIRIEHLTEAQRRAFVLADNKLAENATWNEQKLASELQALIQIDTDFSIELTGFSMGEIDCLIQSQLSINSKDATKEAESLPISCEKRCTPGDLWQAGDHFIFCGDALQEESYRHLLRDKQAEMVITDPPYNVPIMGHVVGKGGVQHQEFRMASGEMSSEQFIAFLKSCFRLMAQCSQEGSIHYIFMDWRHISEILAAGRDVYDSLRNLCVWCKDNAGMGTFYRSQHELVFVFRHGKESHINNFELGQHGRHRSNVWNYPGVNSFAGRKGPEGNLLTLHPTCKPVDLVADAIMDCSTRGGVILDPFLGSGTCLIAAEKTGRKCYGMEIEPGYVDVILQRWENFTGKKAMKVTNVAEQEVKYGSG